MGLCVTPVFIWREPAGLKSLKAALLPGVLGLGQRPNAPLHSAGGASEGLGRGAAFPSPAWDPETAPCVGHGRAESSLWAGALVSFPSISFPAISLEEKHGFY